MTTFLDKYIIWILKLSPAIISMAELFSIYRILQTISPSSLTKSLSNDLDKTSNTLSDGLHNSVTFSVTTIGRFIKIGSIIIASIISCSDLASCK